MKTASSKYTDRMTDTGSESNISTDTNPNSNDICFNNLRRILDRTPLDVVYRLCWLDGSDVSRQSTPKRDQLIPEIKVHHTEDQVSLNVVPWPQEGRARLHPDTVYVPLRPAPGPSLRRLIHVPSDIIWSLDISSSSVPSPASGDKPEPEPEPGSRTLNDRYHSMRVTKQSTPNREKVMPEIKVYHTEDQVSLNVVPWPQEGRARLHPDTVYVPLRPAPGPSLRRLIHVPSESPWSLDSSGSSVPSPASGDKPNDHYHRMRHESHGIRTSEPIFKGSAAGELRKERLSPSVTEDGHGKCDMKVIEPYIHVVSHGGYDATRCPLIIFSACHLPVVHEPNYDYIMDNLFEYVVRTIERMVTDKYVLIFLYGSSGPGRLPTFSWLRKYHDLINVRLRKSLKHVYLVHPSFSLKILVSLTKAFVSSKVFGKLRYVSNLTELQSMVPVNMDAVPDYVKHYDAGLP